MKWFLGIIAFLLLLTMGRHRHHLDRQTSYSPSKTISCLKKEGVSGKLSSLAYNKKNCRRTRIHQ